MCVARIARCVREMWPSPARSSAVQVGKEDRRDTLQIHLDQGNGKCQSDRNQVIRGGTPDRAVGSLGHLGYLA
jgi:hypothetical protein